MTSFGDLEVGAETSRPFNLYRFALGPLAYAYTNNGASFVLGTDTFVAVPVRHSRVIQGAEARQQTVNVTLPADAPFVRQYFGLPPGRRATVSIIRVQRDEVPAFATEVLEYKGYVEDVRFAADMRTADVVCRTVEGDTSRSIPTYSFQALCNHVLYGPACGVNSAAFSVAGTVTSVLGSTIRVSTANTKPDGYFKGGFCKPVGVEDYRMVLVHSGTLLTLLLPFQTSVLTAAMEVFAGCDHKYDSGCKAFGNQARFGGWPFVPSKNIFATGIS